jgi:tetratricopeptide (TPR) repeat protein
MYGSLFLSDKEPSNITNQPVSEQTMNDNLKMVLRVVLVFLVIFFNTTTLMAVAFPFREFEEGDPVPDVTLKGFRDAAQSVTFSKLKGKPFVAVFWGADMPEKVERSAQLLSEMESLMPFLKERQVRLLSVNVLEDDAGTIEQVVTRSKSTIEVFLDQDRKAYAALGLFVMPTILLVDKDGNVAAGMGYSHDMLDRLKGSVEVMLGEKTPEQVLAELRPEMIEKTQEEKTSLRHLGYGLTMMKRGQVEAAIRELAKAVEIDPNLTRAHVQLACIYLEKDQLAEAEKSIVKALEAQPDSLQALICRGELKRKKGLLDEAVKDLTDILKTSPDNYTALYTLAKTYVDQKKFKEAVETFKKAYHEILKFSVAGEK